MFLLKMQTALITHRARWGHKIVNSPVHSGNLVFDCSFIWKTFGVFLKKIVLYMRIFLKELQTYLDRQATQYNQLIKDPGNGNLTNHFCIR
jgi:hypothetical protein